MKTEPKTCSQPGCNEPAERYQWGCDRHWWALPIDERIQIHTSKILNAPVPRSAEQFGGV